MADTPDRPQRPGGPPKGSRPGSARPSKGRPPSGDRRPSRDGDKRAWNKPDGDKPTWNKRDGDKPAWNKRDGDKPTGQKRDGDKPAWQKRDGKPSDRAGRDGHTAGRAGGERGAQRSGPRSGPPSGDEKRLWTREGKPARGDASARERETPEDRDPYGIKSVRARHDAPEIPDDVTPNQLDRVARAQLKTLSKENADEVARHLVMAARLITEDPELAHLHAVSAIAVVRETLAITAYSIGDFALALRELRTYRRISGRDDQLPMMVDCERGLVRPERALELGRSVARASLPVDVQVELAIAMSGARLDLGQTEAALTELELPQLNPDTAYSWSPALFDAYATVLEELGRADEAEKWFNRSDIATAALAEKDASDDSEEDESVEVYEEELDVEGQEAAEDSAHTGNEATEPRSDG